MSWPWSILMPGSSSKPLTWSPVAATFPWRVAIPPDDQTAWVSCRHSDNVLVLERDSNAILQVVTGQYRPAGIAFTQDGARALVGTRNGSDVQVVDTTTFATVATVATDSYPISVVMHPYLPVAYAVHRLYDGTVSVIDTTNWTVVDSIAVGRDPRFATITRDGLKLYVANMDDSSVSRRGYHDQCANDSHRPWRQASGSGHQP